MMRSTKSALQLHDTLENVVNPALVTALARLDKSLDVQEATRQYIRADMGESLKDVISEARQLGYKFVVKLEQFAIMNGITDRAITESQHLTKQARDKISGASEDLGEVINLAQDHANLMANVATIESGLEYLIAADRERLKRVVTLVGTDVMREVLEEMTGKGK